MINFRYHLVSILAVFLAIAIGTVMGASFVGRGLIENLQGRIDRVEQTSDDVRADNARLESELAASDQYTEETAGYVVGRALTNVVAPVIATRGTDGDTVDAQVALLREAGARVPGIVWLEESWSLPDAETSRALREATGLTTRTRAALRTEATELLGRRLAEGPAPDRDLLADLESAGFVTLEAAGSGDAPVAADYAGGAARTLLVSGPDADVPDDVVTGVATGVSGASAPLAIGEVASTDTSQSARTAWIDVVVGESLRGRVSTIELALAQLGTGVTGNYGLGRDPVVPADVQTVPAVTPVAR
jgi:hypothetical protein